MLPDQSGSEPLPFLKRAAYVVKAVLRSPADVATICPSSPQLTATIADRDCIRNARRVVELGPGAGGTTVALLQQMQPQSQLLAIEKTADFVEPLAQIGDPRLEVECGDAIDLKAILGRASFLPVDVVVSGIPFSHLSAEQGQQIVRSVDSVLRPGGSFIAYQMRDAVEALATPVFGPATVQKVSANLPPLRVFSWRKTPNISEG